MRIQARYFGKCSSCGTGIKKGESIEYDRETSSAFHLRCFGDDLTAQDFDAEALADQLQYIEHERAIREQWTLLLLSPATGNGSEKSVRGDDAPRGLFDSIQDVRSGEESA